MNISVILCTFNRCESLAVTLKSIAASRMPAEVEWEVLVVDNNSSDRTRNVVEDFCRSHPGHFRYLFEPKSGKSFALNAGIRNSQGSIVAFVDDDVTVEPDWLWNLCRTFNDTRWAGVGGRTRLAEAFTPPKWMALSGHHSLGGVLAAQFDLGDERCQLANPPYGANMAYRRTMFEKYGSFRTDMGPSADSQIPRPNEDTEFGRRLMAAGERICYEPSAVVYHPVPKNRIRKDYFLKWFFDYGRASIREIGKRPDLWRIQRRYLTITKIGSVVLTSRVFRWWFSIDPAKRFFNKCFVWMTAGQMAEVYRQWGPETGLNRNSAERLEQTCKAKV